ncbi:hypothetical protein M9Y10_005685 [Tritrichomonas musculus]|uniref:Uncharacterized protein n=1 Tax=Tritrichomonas musculus TaxID=1915356 RepID=A0ABR2JCU1_9EUKA
METNKDTLLIEISFNKSKNDATFSLRAIGNEKIKHETLLYNLNKIVNKSDISLIDYTNGGTIQDKPLEPFKELFSDNIVLFYPIDNKLIKNIEKLKLKKTEETEQEEEQTIDNAN